MTDQPEADSTDAERRDPRTVDHYARVEVRCPICGNRDFSDGRDEPHDLDSHYVSLFCEECGTSLSVEYAPIDVRHFVDGDGDDVPEWASGVEDEHSDLRPQYVAYDPDALDSSGDGEDDDA